MGFAQGFAAMDAAITNREKLRADAEVRNQELMKMGYSFDNGQMQVRPGSGAEAEQLQLKEQAQLLGSVQARLSAQDTDNAFVDFAHTGDASYLQKALDTNPQLKQAWASRGVHMVGNIDFSNDHSILARAGVDDAMYDTPEKQAVLKKNAYKYYDGKDWNVGLLSQAAAETGAISRMGERRAGVILDNQTELRNLLAGPKTHQYTAEGHKYEKEITAAAEATGVPANVIASMMSAESSNRVNAVGPVTREGWQAQGLMQLGPAVIKEFGVTDTRDPMQNIMAGAKYLKQNLDKYGGDLKMALAAYNAGPGNVDKYGGVPPFAETQNYVTKIMDNLNGAEEYYNNTADGVQQQLVSQYQRAQQIEDTILASQTARAQAKAGTTPDLEQQKLDIERAKATAALANAGAVKTSTKEKEFDEASATKTQLFDEFGGEDKFYQTDFNDVKNYRKAFDYVTKIEEMTNTKPSEADKKSITDMRKLIELGSKAIDISEDKTGLIDSKLGGLKQYLSDNTSGIAARSAYSAFGNVLLHTFAGTAMSAGELERFTNAFGALGQKKGPVLAQFKTALLQVRAELDSNARNMNPVSAQVRLGADTKKLSSILSAIDATITHVNGMEGIVPNKASVYANGANPEVKAKLDSIFKQTPRSAQ